MASYKRNLVEYFVYLFFVYAHWLSVIFKCLYRVFTDTTIFFLEEKYCGV